MITITAMQRAHLNEVAELEVANEQVQFVGTINEILLNIDENVHPHVILWNNQVIGFFLIDTTYGDHYDFAKTYSLGLRGYFISHPFQGKGYGKKAISLLASYLQRYYSSYSHIYLTVNAKNPAARHCYLNGGFRDTNDLYLGGTAGPQHIMVLKLHK